ncbi:MAG: ATP-binding cassette domain-containing protein [Lachnospiraceae bacterium]
MIKGSRLGFSYFWDGESIPVFEQANIELKEGEWTAILGCNGCGKSTLVRLMNGLLPLQNGNLSVNGINAGNPANKWELCKICGMVFQNPDNQFVSSVLEEDIAFGLENAQVPEREVTSKVKAALELVGLEGYEKRSPSSLSGGQKQRAALAGVLALNPEILIFDEATSMLDPKGRREVLAEMKKLRDCGKTVVMITHDVEEAVLADQVILMGCPNGQKNPNTVLAQGSVREILTDSRLLIQVGIVPPMAVRMYEDLKLAGIELNRCPLTKEELAEALCRWKSEN